jgi:hypothetical protein
VTTLSTNSRRPRSKRSESAVPDSSRECSKCRYALYPATGRCTNYECPRHARETGGALTGAQLMREYAPPPLFHGRHWGDWTLDTERLCLVYDGKPVHRGEGSGVTNGVGAYIAFLGKYEIDLERINQSSALLDWIFQVGRKTWATARVTKDLLNALDDVFHPQRNLCSGGLSGSASRVIANPSAFLKRRIATVGNNSPLGEAA